MPGLLTLCVLIRFQVTATGQLYLEGNAQFTYGSNNRVALIENNGGITISTEHNQGVRMFTIMNNFGNLVIDNGIFRMYYSSSLRGHIKVSDNAQMQMLYANNNPNNFDLFGKLSISGVIACEDASVTIESPSININNMYLWGRCKMSFSGTAHLDGPIINIEAYSDSTLELDSDNDLFSVNTIYMTWSAFVKAKTSISIKRYFHTAGTVTACIVILCL